jgi:translocator protein
MDFTTNINILTKMPISDLKRFYLKNVRNRLPLFGFLALVVVGGLELGLAAPPDEWFAQLAKPAFNPPGWLFAPVWTVLYILIAIAGARAWEQNPIGWPMRIWWLQLFFNFAWSPTFFFYHRIDLALVIIVLLLLCILGFIVSSWRQDRITAWLFVPYAMWVAFATVLNASIYSLN